MTDDPVRRDPDHRKTADAIPLPPPINLARVDPMRDPARFDATVRSILADALAERARLRDAAPTEAARATRSVLATVVAWSRPALAAASLILAIGVTTVALFPVPMAAAPVSLAESAGIPAPLVDWATTNRATAASGLVDTFDAFAVAVAVAPPGH